MADFSAFQKWLIQEGFPEELSNAPKDLTNQQAEDVVEIVMSILRKYNEWLSGNTKA